MKRIKLFFLVCLIFCFNIPISIAQTNSLSTSLDGIQQSEIQRLLDNWRVHSGIPSAAISILLPNSSSPSTFTTGSKVYQGVEKTTDATLFQIGSVTKSYTSAIILTLESEGKLDINDPITRYLPQYAPRWQNITIKQLLNHTSGIYNYTEAGIFNSIRKESPRAGFTPQQIVHIALSHRNYFPSGEGFKYSNTNYVIAGMIIEKVTGQPIDQVLNHYLKGGFKLNLPNTYFASGLYTQGLMSRMANGYSTDGENTLFENMSWANTAGGLVSNTQDLLTWWKGLFGGVVLPKKQMDEMMSLVCEKGGSNGHPGCSREHISDDEVGRGYGLGVMQTGWGSERVGTAWWHNGTTKGYEAIAMWFPKNNIYITMTIARNPGYFLKPTLPFFQRILGVIVPGAEWRTAHTQKLNSVYAVRHHTIHASHHHRHG